MNRPGPSSPSVEGVSQERMADGGEVDPDLVGPAGLREDLEERAVLKFFGLLPAGNGCPSSPGPCGHPFSLARVPSDSRIDHAFVLAELAVDNGEVDLFDSPV